MKGILFKPDMIKAIQEGRKTVTRRIIKLESKQAITPTGNPAVWAVVVLGKDGKPVERFDNIKALYQVGETVYIKEAWADMICLASTEKGKGKGESSPIYKSSADSTELKILQGHWKSPLLMPAWAARYFLKITDVRVERLQEITEEDAFTEGINEDYAKRNNLPPLNFMKDDLIYCRHLYVFMQLWDSINKPPYDWQSNCWVFRYEFEKVSSGLTNA